ncbi:MAG: hypothetical protein E7486_01955 [Ruminococcaceae bacterium]|nr:hypothetical protein [Oscillospiraceae bacterium]
MDKRVLWKLSYGLYAIGVSDQGRACGCIVNTVMQVTSDSPAVTVCLNKNNYTTQLLQKTGVFTVSILSEKTNPATIGALGFASGRDTHKFMDVPFRLVEDLPVVEDAVCGGMLCRVTSITDVGTHLLFVGKVVDAFAGETDAPPMTYEYYHKVVKGSAPKNAPTYRGQEEQTAPSEEPVYVCGVCGYEHQGELPEDFKCPICKQPREVFRKK